MNTNTNINKLAPITSTKQNCALPSLFKPCKVCSMRVNNGFVCTSCDFSCCKTCNFKHNCSYNCLHNCSPIKILKQKLGE